MCYSLAAMAISAGPYRMKKLISPKKVGGPESRDRGGPQEPPSPMLILQFMESMHTPCMDRDEIWPAKASALPR